MDSNKYFTKCENVHKTVVYFKNLNKNISFRKIECH